VVSTLATFDRLLAGKDASSTASPSLETGKSGRRPRRDGALRAGDDETRSVNGHRHGFERKGSRGAARAHSGTTTALEETSGAALDSEPLFPPSLFTGGVAAKGRRGGGGGGGGERALCSGGAGGDGCGGDNSPELTLLYLGSPLAPPSSPPASVPRRPPHHRRLRQSREARRVAWPRAQLSPSRKANATLVIHGGRV